MTIIQLLLSALVIYITGEYILSQLSPVKNINIRDKYGYKITNGKIAEDLVADKLTEVFHEEVLTNLLVPTRTDLKTTEIDIAQVTTKGIFVVETKFRNGSIEGDIDSDYWMIDDDNAMQNPIKQNYYHIEALKESLGDTLQGIPIINVAVVVGDLTDKKGTAFSESYDNVFVFTDFNSIQQLSTLPDVITKEKVNNLTRQLQVYEATEEKLLEHAKRVKGSMSV